MVEFSRHILTIALFILQPERCRLFNKTFKGGFRYENFVFFGKNQLCRIALWLISAARTGCLVGYLGIGRPSSARTFFMSSQTFLRFSCE